MSTSSPPSGVTPFYESRTFWVSLFALVSMVATTIVGYESEHLATLLGSEGVLLSLVNMALKIWSKDKQGLIDDTQNSPGTNDSQEDNKNDTPCPGSGNTSEPAGSGQLRCGITLLLGAISLAALTLSSCGLSLHYDEEDSTVSLSRGGENVLKVSHTRK